MPNWVGDLGPTRSNCWRTGWRGRLRNAGALLGLREGILARIADRATQDSWPPTPQRLVHDIRQVMPEDGIVALDNGMYKIWFARNYRTHVANTRCCWTTHWPRWGPGCRRAMMAAMLYPGRRVLAVCGDGGFMMNSQEMETAVRLGLSLVVLVIEDGAYGMIRWKAGGRPLPRLWPDVRQPRIRALCRELRRRRTPGHEHPAT